MNLRAEYEQYREEARRRDAEDVRVMVVAFEKRLDAMWRMIEQFDAENKKLRLELGRLETQTAEERETLNQQLKRRFDQKVDKPE